MRRLAFAIAFLLLPLGALAQTAGPPPSALLNSANTWMKQQNYGNATTQGVIVLDGPVSAQRDLRFTTGNSQRWSIQGHNGTEPGNNVGTDLWIRSFTDTGTTIGQVLQASRASGPFGLGPPYFNFLATYQQTQPRQTTPGGVAGNLQDFSAGIDLSPVTTLLANPISTTAGSRVVNFTWANCCSTTGALYSATREVWVSINGAGLVAGIDFRPVDNPNGWYKVTIVNNNTFSILVNTTSGPANATITGGGTTTTVQPSAGVQGNKQVINVTTGTNGFPDGNLNYYVANPLFYTTTGNGPRYQQSFTQVYTPNDQTDNNIWGTVGHEWNFINRGKDYGYQPNIPAQRHNLTGLWMGPLAGAVTVVPGGGNGTNWGAVIGCFGGGGVIGVYSCLNTQPDSLVGAALDPTGHGGVGVEVFGSYDVLADVPFTVNVGSSLVSVYTKGGAADSMADGATVYLPNVYTLNGVTFGGKSYVTQNTDHAGNSFKIQGQGTATGGANGGSAGEWASFATVVPFAPSQFWGEFKHGLTANRASEFDDGLMVNSTPGAGMGWTENPDAANITAPTTASVTGTLLSPGNIEVVLTAAGTGAVRAASPVRLRSYTVALLPPCVAALDGALVEVSDATAPNYNAALTGGGTVRVPAFCNGAAWSAH